MTLRLVNPGAACYMNSAVQFLTQIKDIDWTDSSSSMGRLLNALVKAKYSGETHSIPVWADLNKLVQPEHRYVNRQGDAHEIVLEILQQLNNDALVNRYFGITLCNFTKCLRCNNISEREEVTNQFIVTNGSGSLQNYFSGFFTAEAINEYECTHCTKANSKLRTTAERSVRVKHWPRYLIFYLMRFNGNQKDMSPFNYSLMFVGSKPTDPEYILESAILHSGRSRDSGHYETLGRIDQGLFHLFNDEHVPRLYPQTDVIKTSFQEQVYVLLYRKVPRKN